MQSTDRKLLLRLESTDGEGIKLPMNVNRSLVTTNQRNSPIEEALEYVEKFSWLMSLADHYHQHCEDTEKQHRDWSCARSEHGNELAESIIYAYAATLIRALPYVGSELTLMRPRLV